MTEETLYSNLMGVQVAPSTASMKSLYLVQSGTQNYPGAVEGTIITAEADQELREDFGKELEIIILGAKQFYTHTLGGKLMKNQDGKTRMTWVNSPSDGLPNSNRSPDGVVKNNLHNKYVILLADKLADGDKEAYNLTLKPGSFKGVADISKALKGKPQQNVVLSLSVRQEENRDGTFKWQGYRVENSRDSTAAERALAKEVMDGVLVPQLEQSKKPQAIVDRGHL